MYKLAKMPTFFLPRFLVINWAENEKLFIYCQNPVNVYSADKTKKTAEEPGYVTSYIFYIIYRRIGLALFITSQVTRKIRTV